MCLTSQLKLRRWAIGDVLEVITKGSSAAVKEKLSINYCSFLFLTVPDLQWPNR